MSSTGSRGGPVLVVGATGTTGSRVAAGLEAAGATVRRANRSGSAGTRFDWSDPAACATALDGVGSVYLIAPVDESEPADLVAPVLRAALARGLRRVVLLSSSLVEESDAGLGALVRLAREAPEPAVLRPSWFAQNFLGDQPVAIGVRAGRVLTASGAGRVPFVDAGDIAAVAVRALLDEQVPAGDLVLTGPRALSYDEACAEAAAVLGRPVEHVSVPGPAFVEHLVGNGVPAGVAGMLAALDARIAAGEEDRTTDVVARVTGREPRAFPTVLAEGLAV